VRFKVQSSEIVVIATLCLTACTGGTEEVAFVSPTESEFISYYNREPSCNSDGCFSFTALSAAPKEKPWVWCAQIETRTGTPYYNNDGLIARVDWNESKISESCFRVATDESGKILYTEAVN
jgi:hypothetical protein